MYIIEDKLQQYQRITGKKIDPAELPEPDAIEPRLRPLVAEIMLIYLDEQRSEISAAIDGFPRHWTMPGTAGNDEFDARFALERVKLHRARWQVYLPVNL